MSNIESHYGKLKRVNLNHELGTEDKIKYLQELSGSEFWHDFDVDVNGDFSYFLSDKFYYHKKTKTFYGFIKHYDSNNKDIFKENNETIEFFCSYSNGGGTLWEALDKGVDNILEKSILNFDI